MRLRLASRKSDLARWQAVQVARALETLPAKPAIEYIFKASLGDQDLVTPLAEMPAKGVFTEDFYEDLLGGRCDMVVHSWKDLPIEARTDSGIVLTLPRADVRDLLLVPHAVWERARSEGRLKILTSSPRRIYNLGRGLADLLPGRLKLEFENVRGNVPTRLEKMHRQGAALVLAKAGVDRLMQAEGEGFLQSGLSVVTMVRGCRFQVLPLSLNPAAPAQGALAVETLRTNEGLNSACAALNDERTYHCVEREREVLRTFGGGCHQKIGVTVLGRDYGHVVALKGLTESGEILDEWKIESSVPWTRAQSVEQVFPMNTRDNAWFDRQRLSIDVDLASKPALFISRSEALPVGFRPGPKQLVWTAGRQTWQRLAQLGIWVNGTADGLGENENPLLEHLVGAVNWTKLSHLRGYTRPETELIATYQLIPRKSQPNLAGKTHFFWMSSTSFERARQMFPHEINQGYNACGPGSTHELIRRMPGLKNAPKVFIGLEQFLAETMP